MPTYKNGAIPRSAMKQFRNTGKYGHPVFIDRLEAAFQELERAGYKPYIAAGQDIYRDLAGQRYWKNYWTSQGRPGNAAAVGYSKHGLGVSADISGVPKTSAVIAIFKRHHIEFNYPPETWHVSDTSIQTWGDTQVVINPPAPAASQTVKNEQAWLNKARGEKLAVDGIRGPGTIAAFKRYQTFLRAYGYKGAIDGNWGAGTQAAHAKYYTDFNKPQPAIKDVVKNQQARLNVWGAATPALVVDGIPGPKFTQAVKVFQKAHGFTVDGIIGPKTWALLATDPPKPAVTRATIKQGARGADVKYLQSKLGLLQDSIFGPATKAKVVAFQRSKGLTPDGIVGAKTWAQIG